MGLKEDLEIVMNMKPLGHKPNLAPQAKRLSEDRLLFDAEDLSMMKHTAQRRQWLQEEANIQIVNLVDQCTTLMQREAALAAQKEQVRELVEAVKPLCEIWQGIAPKSTMQQFNATIMSDKMMPPIVAALASLTTGENDARC